MSSHTLLSERVSLSLLRRAIGTHDLLAYFVMAFAFSWLAVLPLLLARSGLVALPKDMPVVPFQIAGALAGPTLAAYVVTAIQDGRPGLRHLLGRYGQWRVGLHWYLLVVFGPLLALTLGAIPFVGLSIVSAFLRNGPLLVSFFLPALIIGAFLGPLWEEPGWRGFALPRLQEKYGPLVGTLTLGVLWGLWHLPGFLGGWLGSLTISSFAALMLGTTASSFVLTWIYNRTKGSLFMMILLHSSFNAAVAFGGKILPVDIPESISTLVFSGWIPAVTYTLWALLILIQTSGRLSQVQMR